MNDAKKIFTAIAIFILMATGRTSGEETITDINAQIHETRMEIQQIRKRTEKQKSDSLRKNRGYVYMIQNQEDIDALRKQNQQYLERARHIVRRKNVSVCAPSNEIIFMMYRNIPQISTLQGLYNINKSKIKKFERKTTGCEIYGQSVKNHFDSIMHAQIDSCQMVLDLLLDKKAEMLR